MKIETGLKFTREKGNEIMVKVLHLPKKGLEPSPKISPLKQKK